MRIDANSAVIVRSTIELAHALGLTTVAEGVEDQPTYEALTALGCDRMQGYHIARPMPVAMLHAWSAALPQVDDAGGRDRPRSAREALSIGTGQRGTSE